MLTEIEFEANDEKNKITNKESEWDNHINNAGKSQYTKSGTIWATAWFFQHSQCNKRHSIATISDYGSTSTAISDVFLQIFMLINYTGQQIMAEFMHLICLCLCGRVPAANALDALQPKAYCTCTARCP